MNTFVFAYVFVLHSCPSLPPASPPAPLRLLLSSAACQCRQKSKTSSSSAIQGDLALPLPPPPSPLYPQPALHVLFSISFSHCLWQRISGIAGLLSLIDDHSNSDCLCRCRCPLPCPASALTALLPFSRSHLFVGQKQRCRLPALACDPQLIRNSTWRIDFDQPRQGRTSAAPRPSGCPSPAPPWPGQISARRKFY